MDLTWTTWSLGRIKCRYIDFHSSYTREYQLDITLLLQFSDGDNKYIAGEIGKGVQYMHHHNPVIIHQDLKPQNILVSVFIAHRVMPT